MEGADLGPEGERIAGSNHPTPNTRDANLQLAARTPLPPFPGIFRRMPAPGIFRPGAAWGFRGWGWGRVGLGVRVR